MTRVMLILQCLGVVEAIDNPGCSRVVAVQREKPMAVGNPLRPFREAAQKERPMAVGGIGMITTANYVARRHGSNVSSLAASCLPAPSYLMAPWQ